jgi:hypothetical protein
MYRDVLPLYPENRLFIAGDALNKHGGLTRAAEIRYHQ